MSHLSEEDSEEQSKTMLLALNPEELLSVSMKAGLQCEDKEATLVVKISVACRE